MTSFVLFAPHAAHVFCTFSPGVRHMNFARSNAVVVRGGTVPAQSQTRSARSGSLTAKSALQAGVRSMGVEEVMATIWPGTEIGFGVIPVFDSAIRQFVSVAAPVLRTT